MKIESGSKKERNDANNNYKTEKGHPTTERDGASMASKEAAGDSSRSLDDLSVPAAMDRGDFQSENRPQAPAEEFDKASEQHKVDESKP